MLMAPTWVSGPGRSFFIRPVLRSPVRREWEREEDGDDRGGRPRYADLGGLRGRHPGLAGREMRILLAFQDQHGTYMDAIGTAIRNRHPQAEVFATHPATLEEDIDRLEPHLLICDPPISENPAYKVPAWIELSIDPARPSRFRVERRWESLNPGLEEVLVV